ncbi:2-phospho-L-lactate transferase CofD family protein [Actinoplanes sp. NPDC051346]|uniref:gluconeogenesis factor YvcK family protein n=1 Tax=Actinoplanes sp. NPDC051346 TaxID=3155048 RepID=UPI003437C0CA
MDARRPIKVVAFGGGHGLAASLKALRLCSPQLELDITAVVTVGDNGGSSGRLRAERDAQLPPGDLRMALAALADDDPTHQTTVRLMQHRFAPVGNPDRRQLAADLTSTGNTESRTGAPGPDNARMPDSATPTGNTAESRDGALAHDNAAGPDNASPTGNTAESRDGAPAPDNAPAPQQAGAFQEADANPEGMSGWGDVDRRIAAVGGKHDPLAGHAVGNLLLLGLLELMDDPVDALAHAGNMVGAKGRVLPMACHAVGIEADVRGADPARPGDVVTVRGQHAVAVASGHVEALRIVPSSPPACAAAVEAIGDADWLIFGPGSWYTSVLPHLLVPELAAAIVASPARRLVTMNLAADNETLGLSVADHLATLHWYLPELHVDVVLADAKWVGEPDPVHRAAEVLGARLVLAPLAVADGSPKHDPESLGTALVPLLGPDR